MTTETNISNAEFNIKRAKVILETVIDLVTSAEVEMGEKFGNLANITADLFTVDKKLVIQRAELEQMQSTDKSELTIDVLEAFITAVKDFSSFDTILGNDTMYFTEIQNLTCPPSIAKDHYKRLNFSSLASEVAEELDGYGGHGYDEYKSKIVRMGFEHFIRLRPDLERQAKKLIDEKLFENWNGEKN